MPMVYCSSTVTVFITSPCLIELTTSWLALSLTCPLIHTHRGMFIAQTFLFRINGHVYAISLPADQGNFVKSFHLYRIWLDDPTSIEVDTHPCLFEDATWKLAPPITLTPTTAPPQGFSPNGERTV